MTSEITVVGGGLTGLIAAISVAENGGEALLLERSAKLGGRARTASAPYRTNLGPHALYSDGPLWKWLKQRSLLPRTRPPQLRSVVFHHRGKLRRGAPRPFLVALRHTFGQAPDDIGYRDWLGHRGVAKSTVDPCCKLGGFFTFDADPGRLSARFVNERYARLVRPPYPARFIVGGGWEALIERLQAHAVELGVQIRTSVRVEVLPNPPVIVAVELRDAAPLLGQSELAVPHARTVLLDVALRQRRGDPSAVTDLDHGAFVERYTAFDDGLAPDGEQLLQAHVGLADGEAPSDGVAKIEQVLDGCFKDWRARETWRAVRDSDGRSGAVELPDRPWSSRPAIDRGDGVFLAGDSVAAPGLLAEVGWRSAVDAARGAVRCRGSSPTPPA
jgi:glycine/D-amino acid oxidase-like deaminating enzyme